MSSKKHNRTWITIAFCDGGSLSQKGPKISDKQLRKAAKRMEKGLQNDLAEYGHPTASDIHDQVPEGVAGDAHVIKIVALSKPAKDADWDTIWAREIPCEHMKVAS